MLSALEWLRDCHDTLAPAAAEKQLAQEVGKLLKVARSRLRRLFPAFLDHGQPDWVYPMDHGTPEFRREVYQLAYPGYPSRHRLLSGKVVVAGLLSVQIVVRVAHALSLPFPYRVLAVPYHVPFPSLSPCLAPFHAHVSRAPFPFL